MAKMFNFFKRHPLTLANQNVQIQGRYANFQHHKEGNKYVWIGNVQPAPLSQIYRVKIEYDLKHSPSVYVLSPELKSYDGKTRIPHMYEQKRLCLYLPGSGEWNNQKFIAETVVPWISLWLFYYEIWASTGEWLGGGVHPPEGKTEDN